MWLLRVAGILALGALLLQKPSATLAWAWFVALILAATLASLLELRRPLWITTLLALLADFALLGALLWASGGASWAYWLFLIPTLNALLRAGSHGAYLGAPLGVTALLTGAWATAGEAAFRDPTVLSSALGVAGTSLALGWAWARRTEPYQNTLLEQAAQAVEQTEAAHRELRQNYRELAYHYHRLEEHLTALQDASEILHALQRAREPDAIHHTLLERLRVRFGASGAALYLTDESGALLRIACAVGSLSELAQTAAVAPLRPFQKESPAQAVAEQLRAVVLGCERLQEAHAAPERADALVLTLQSGGRIVGAITLSTRAHEGFPPESRARLRNLAPYLSGLLELTDQMRLMSIRLAETQFLYDLENLLFSAETTQSLPARALPLLKAVLPFEHAQLLLRRGQKLELAAQMGALPNLCEQFCSDESLWRAQILDSRHSQIGAFTPAQSVLIAPLHGGIRAEGFIVLARSETPPFVEADLETLRTLAFQMTTVLERAQLLSDLERLATTDGLTGLYNYRHFQERYREEVRLCQRYQHPLAIMLIDLDGFKQVNDQHGHLEGDYLLVQLAEVLQNALRNTEFIARYGGDEFVVMMHATNLQGGVAAAKRVVQAVRDTQFLDTQGQPRLKITISVGVAAYPSSTDNPAEVLEKADQALEIAKRSGRNQVVALENTA
ncbi:MAG: GGDEF domain-containing protein [Fimbriimonadales bacterium]|nr:GGDEF domain-containing protein [Fimbriimonadales bacterium]